MATNNAIDYLTCGPGLQVYNNNTVGTIIANKGEILVGNGTNSATVLPVGTDTYVIVADSSQSVGMKYTATEPAVVQVSRAFGYGNSLTNYIFPVNMAGVSTLSATLTANTLYCVPFNITLSTTFSKIGMKIGTTAAKNIRLGIYDATGTGGYPGSLVLDAGTITANSLGEQTISISQLLYGNYWMVFISDGAARPLLGVSASTAENVIGCAVTNPTGLISLLSEASVGSYFTSLPASLSSDTFTYNTTSFSISSFVFLQV